MALRYDMSLSKKSVKFLMKQEPLVQSRIAQALEGIRMVPPEGDIKPMKGYSGVFRLRVGTYRIIFEVNHLEKIVYIRSIGNRGDIYK